MFLPVKFKTMGNPFLLHLLISFTIPLQAIELTVSNNYHAKILITVTMKNKAQSQTLLATCNQTTIYLEDLIEILQVSIPSWPLKKPLCLIAPYQNPSSTLFIQASQYNALQFSSDNLREQQQV